MKYEVQTYTVCDGWVNCWTTIHENDNETPAIYATREEAEAAITDHLADVAYAVKAGEMAEEYHRDDYRIVGLGASVKYA